MGNTPHVITHSVGGAVLLLTAVLLGCATVQNEPTQDSTEIVLPLPEDQVRTALVQVLTDDGYPVRKTDEEKRVISTGYREETDGPWDWLLVYRFGVDRSRVDATLTPEDQTTTRLSIQVTYEAKSHFWSSWQESTPSLPRNAATQIRRVKKVLGLL